MKIIHLISCLGNGGAQRLVFDLANAQSNINNDVTICSFRPDKGELSKEKSSKVKFVTFNKKKGFDFFFPIYLYQYLKKEKPDVVNCHLPSVFLYVALSILLLKKVKFFYTIHTDVSKDEPRLIVRKIRKYFIDKQRFIPIAISDIVENDFKNLYQIKEITTVYNGRKILEKTSDFEKVYKEIQAYKKNENTLVFIAVGRISKVKNHILLVEVFKELEMINENVILLIVGDSQDEELFKTCIEAKADNTHFLGLKNNVSDYLFCSDVFCMSSEYEGLPIAILEAISIGLPVISTNVGGISDVIIDGENGFLVHSLNKKDYLDVVKRYLSADKKEIQNISKNNKRLFKEKYDIESKALEYQEIYKKYTFQ